MSELGEGLVRAEIGIGAGRGGAGGGGLILSRHIDMV